MTFLEYLKDNRENIRVVLLDIDGTLIRVDHALPGAAVLPGELKKKHVPYLVLTNDANHSLQEKSAIMRKAGIDISPDEIVSGGSALGALVNANHWQGRKFFVLGQLGTPCFAEKAGLVTCRDERLIDECFGIIGAEGFYRWHDHMQAAINFFRRHPDAPFVVPNPDSFWPGRNGTIGVGAGGQARFICGILAEAGVEIKPLYLGKPYRPVYDCAVETIRRRFPELAEVDSSQMIMLGDSLMSDIRGANRCNMKSGLVLTGITGREEAEKAEGECRPDLIFDRLS